MPKIKLDLKLRLALQVCALAALCFIAAAIYVLVDADRTARARAESAAGLAARELALQRGQQMWVANAPVAFPDLGRIAPALMTPGLCVAYRTPHGETVQRLCGGVSPEDAEAPRLFAALYERMFGAGREAVRPVMSGGMAHGEAVASIEPQSLIGAGWRETSRIAAVTAPALATLCLLTYAALAKALAPTRGVCAGLERLAAGDLAARLPPFDLAELSAVGDVFNQLAGELETTRDERNELTRRLIAVQDEERRALARELHDEFGQCLAAIAAVAASAGQTAREECPALIDDCESVLRISAHMMDVLRGALLRLRPPDVEELGLAASLEGLVAGWNARAGGRTRFSLDLDGDFAALPQDLAANLYRIAQEAATNAARHAQASKVDLCLRIRRSETGEGGSVEIEVDDDGRAGAELAVKSGMGLLGMRERVAALGGVLSVEPSRPNGLRLRAEIPLPAPAPNEMFAA